MIRRRPTPGSTKALPPAPADQLDLFGTAPDSVVSIPRQRTSTPAGTAVEPTTTAPGSAESNDMDLMIAVAGNASRGLYVLVGPNERVYVRTDGPEGRDVVRVPRYEEAAVHQLLRRGWLSSGGRTKELGCGAATLSGTAVNCPKSTKARVARWNALVRPPTWPQPTNTPARPALRVINGEGVRCTACRDTGRIPQVSYPEPLPGGGLGRIPRTSPCHHCGAGGAT